MAHKTLINGTFYDIKSGRTLIGGTGYDIKKGRTLIDGTEYDIKFGVPVGELAVGTSVYMNVGGVQKEFIIVHQGNPNPAIYDASCNGTWLMIKDIYDTSESGFTTTTLFDQQYSTSKAFQHLNETVLQAFEPSIQKDIRKVNIPVYTSNVSNLTAKIFHLSCKEIGYSGYSPLEGAKLDYFENTNYGEDASATRIAYYEGSASAWELRSMYWTDNTRKPFIVKTDGTIYELAHVLQWKNRFALIMAVTQLVDSDFNIIPS